MKYSVLNEPWIPLEDGLMHSLIDCLENSAALPGVACKSPLETYAVYRTMIAFAMDALQLDNRDDRFALFRRGCFPEGVFRDYADRCEREGCSFDLFDEKRPFMQAAYDPKYDQEKNLKPIAVIIHNVPSGNNHVFFDHERMTDRILDYDQALRNLLTSYVFCTAGAQEYPSSVNNTPCEYVMIQGDNLFETLVLNMVSIRECGNIAYGKPAWRTSPNIEPKKEWPSVDMLQALTWLPRRITLLPDDAQRNIRQVWYQQGYNFKGNEQWRDPFVAYRVLKDGTLNSVKPQQGRAFWRDMGSMAVSKENHYGKPPQIVMGLPPEIGSRRLKVVGLATNKGAILDSLQEEMLIPKAILEDEDHGEQIHIDLSFIEICASSLFKTFKESVGQLPAQTAQDNYFLAVHDYLFSDYLPELQVCQQDENYDQLCKNVEDTLQKILINILNQMNLRSGFDGKTIEIQAKLRKQVLDNYFVQRRIRENERK